MVVNVTHHAMIRANERFCWTEAKIKQYWSDHVDYSVFNDGEGVYGVVLSGVYFVVAYDPAQDQLTIMSLCHSRSRNVTGWQKPLRVDTPTR